MSDVEERTSDEVKKRDVTIIIWSSINHVAINGTLLTARTKPQPF